MAGGARTKRWRKQRPTTSISTVQPREFSAADAADLPGARGGGVPRPHRDHHGARRTTYRDFFARSRRLASALAKRGITRGDTVAVVLANSPAMLEAHYGVPMTGGVLNTVNTRLDAATIGFIFDHADAKVVIVDREFSKVVKEALAHAKVKPVS